LSDDPIATVNVIPDAMIATVDECVLPIPGARGEPLPRAWVYTSEGFESMDQREFILVLRMRSGDDSVRYAEEPLSVLYALHGWVSEGKRFDAGACMTLGEPADFGGAAVGGFAFVDVPDWTQFPWIDPDDYEHEPLLVLPLPVAEIQAAYRFGLARVLALLGAQTRSYPHPWWFDRDRAPVLHFDAYRESTILAGAPALSMPYIEVVQDRLRFQVLYDAVDGEWLHDTLADAPEAACLLPRVARSAQALYFWQPGQSGPAAIEPADGQGGDREAGYGTGTYGLNFLMLGHGDVKPMLRQVEDGLAMTMPEPVWRQLLSHLAAAEPFTWRGPEGSAEVVFSPQPQGVDS